MRGNGDAAADDIVAKPTADGGDPKLNLGNLAKYPNIHETRIKPSIEHVAEYVSDDTGAQTGLAKSLDKSNGRLAVRAQCGMGKTTALEHTVPSMVACSFQVW